MSDILKAPREVLEILNFENFSANRNNFGLYFVDAGRRSDGRERNTYRSKSAIEFLREVNPELERSLTEKMTQADLEEEDTALMYERELYEAYKIMRRKFSDEELFR